jgi:hypothetical protein
MTSHIIIVIWKEQEDNFFLQKMFQNHKSEPYNNRNPIPLIPVENDNQQSQFPRL